MITEPKLDRNYQEKLKSAAVFIAVSRNEPIEK